MGRGGKGKNTDKYERYKEHNLAYARAHSEQNKRLHRERRYGQGAHEHFVNQLKVQENRCAVCGDPLVAGRSTHLDHDHETGQWRGALCVACNRLVGLLENRTWTQKAQAYLAHWGARWEK